MKSDVDPDGSPIPADAEGDPANDRATVEVDGGLIKGPDRALEEARGTQGVNAVVDDVRLDLYYEKKLTPEEKAQVKAVLSSDKWPKELQAFASKEMIPEKITSETLRNLEDHLEFIRTNVPLDVLKAYRGIALPKLLRQSLPFLSAMVELLGKEAWEETLLNDEKCYQYSCAAHLGSPAYRLSDEIFEGFAKRDAVPVEAQEGAEDRLEELKEVLAHTGIDQIALPLANKITFGKPDNPNTMKGHNDNFTGDVMASTGVERKPLLIAALLHELGHALEKRVSRDSRAREVFDRYIVLSQIEDTKNSPYVDSFRLTNGRAGYQYIAESFAEDFRLYFLKPEELGARKIAIFDDFCDRFLPKVDRDDVRKRIRSALGNFYGRSVNDVFKIIDCYNPREMAEERGRRKADER